MEDSPGIGAKLGRDTLLYIVAALTLALDQLTKFLVRAYLPEQESFPVGSPIRLTHVTNTGAAFSLLQGQTILFIVITFVVIGIILTYDRFLPSSGRLVKLSLGLQLGGALGNLLDRLRFGGRVTDFIATDFWPTFNLADSAIVVGVIILVLLLLFSGDEKEPLRPSHDESKSLPS